MRVLKYIIVLIASLIWFISAKSQYLSATTGTSGFLPNKTNNYFYIGNWDATAGDKYVECYFKINSQTGTQVLFGTNNSVANKAFYCYFFGSDLSIRFFFLWGASGNSIILPNSEKTFCDGNWHYLKVGITTNKMYVKIDNYEKNSTSQAYHTFDGSNGYNFPIFALNQNNSLFFYSNISINRLNIVGGSFNVSILFNEGTGNTVYESVSQTNKTISGTTFTWDNNYYLNSTLLTKTKLLGYGNYNVVFGDIDANKYLATIRNYDNTLNYNAIYNLVYDLKASGIWYKAKIILPFYGATATAHAVNLKNTATYTATFVGSPTHDANGCDFNGSSQYINTTLNGLSAFGAGNISSSFVYYCNENVNDPSGALVLGMNATGTPATRLNIRSNDLRGGYINSSGTSISVASSTSIGLFELNRQNDNLLQLFVNGAEVSRNTTAESNTSFSNLNLYVGCRNNNGTPANYSTQRCAFFAVLSGLTDAESAQLYTIILKYETALGRQ